MLATSIVEHDIEIFCAQEYEFYHYEAVLKYCDFSDVRTFVSESA